MSGSAVPTCIKNIVQQIKKNGEFFNYMILEKYGKKSDTECGARTRDIGLTSKG